MVPGIRGNKQGWKEGDGIRKKKPRAEPIWEDRNSRSGVRAVGSPVGLVVLEGHPCLSALVDRIDGSANKTARVWIHLGAVAADFPVGI